MPSANDFVMLAAALAVSLTASSAAAKSRAVRPSTRVEAPVAQPPQRLAYVPAPRRTEAPDLVLRPEFSEGEWPDQSLAGRLDPAALQDAAAPVDSEVGRATTPRAGSTLAKIGDRPSQGAPVPTSRLDQPMDRAPGPAVTFGGFDFGTLNLRRAD